MRADLAIYSLAVLAGVCLAQLVVALLPESVLLLIVGHQTFVISSGFASCLLLLLATIETRAPDDTARRH